MMTTNRLKGKLTTEQSFTSKLNNKEIYIYPELEELTVTPTLNEQELEPTKYGYSKIKVEKIPATDLTVSPTEEQQNLQGIFKEVNINPIQVQEITTDLDFSSSDAIELTAQDGVYIKKATINKDANLTPENIKSGVTVCGVSGDVADTSDADATSDDIVAGKTAYVANEKIQGTYEPLDTSDATATAGDIAKDKTAYVNGKKIIGTLQVSSENSELGSCSAKFEISTEKVFQEAFNYDRVVIKLRELNNFSVKGMTTLWSAFEYSTSIYKYETRYLQKLSIKDTEKVTGIQRMCANLTQLITIEWFDSSNITEFGNSFNGCSALVNFPLLNTSKAVGFNSMFTGCTKLSEESLNNILAMCVNATPTYINTKTLAAIGLTSAQATKCTTLSNYQAFLDARLDYRLLKL